VQEGISLACGQHLLQYYRIKFSNQKHVLIVEFTSRGLGHFIGFELSAIDEFERGKNGLKLGVCFVRDVFSQTNVNLQRIKFFPQIGRQEGHVSGNADF